MTAGILLPQLLVDSQRLGFQMKMRVKLISATIKTASKHVDFLDFSRLPQRRQFHSKWKLAFKREAS